VKRSSETGLYVIHGFRVLLNICADTFEARKSTNKTGRRSHLVAVHRSGTVLARKSLKHPRLGGFEKPEVSSADWLQRTRNMQAMITRKMEWTFGSSDLMLERLWLGFGAWFLLRSMRVAKRVPPAVSRREEIFCKVTQRH
jgi:hypothetical protein